MLLLFTTFACQKQNKSNFKTDQNELKRQLLSCEICSLNLEMVYCEYYLYVAKAENIPLVQIDSISYKKKIIDSTFESRMNNFERLITYNPTQINSPLLKAQYLCAKTYFNGMGIYPTPQNLNDFFSPFIEDDSRKFEISFTHKDSLTWFPLNMKTPAIATMLGLDWEKMSYEDKIKANCVVQTTVWLSDAQQKIATEHYFPLTYQNENKNCGPTCLKMISEFYGKYHDIDQVEKMCKTDSSGTSYTEIIDGGSALNFDTRIHYLNYDDLLRRDNFPLIAAWNSIHYVVVFRANHKKVWVADPIHGIKIYKREAFCKSWQFNGAIIAEKGLIITLSPRPGFFLKE